MHPQTIHVSPQSGGSLFSERKVWVWEPSNASFVCHSVEAEEDAHSYSAEVEEISATGARLHACRSYEAGAVLVLEPYTEALGPTGRGQIARVVRTYPCSEGGQTVVCEFKK